jgi:hypothetical protein
MTLNKRYTTSKTGNYVRYFLFLAVLAAMVISCDKLNMATDDPRDNLVGVWSCSENSQIFGVQSYDAGVSKFPTDTTKILIDNFYGLGSEYSVYAKMNNLNLTIPSQTVNGYQVSGSGTISSNYKTIDWTYTVTGAGQTDHVTAVYSK